MADFQGWTLDAIIRRNARRFPQKKAVVSRAGILTWSGLDTRVDKVAGALAAAGLRRGDRVAILLPNCREFIELYMGISRAGMIAVPVNYRLTPKETAAILASAEPQLLVVGADYLATATALEGLLPGLTRRWLVDGAAGSYETALAAQPATVVEAAGGENDPFAIFFTSGTTGLPKGAVVSHRNLEANGYNQAIADASRGDDINLVATPLYHMGAVFMAVTYMMLGCTQVILDR
ncbi:MAG TPA: AMP-binding protein, partial [Rhodospirillaceae bacterium]|nr:AMP-binding protein [Rhodospirillaceae bacterium]